MRSAAAFLLCSLCCLASVHGAHGASLDAGQVAPVHEDGELTVLLQCAVRCYTSAISCVTQCGAAESSCSLQCRRDEAKCYCACKDVQAAALSPSSTSLVVAGAERGSRGGVWSINVEDDDGALDTAEKVRQCEVGKASAVTPCITGCMSAATIDEACVAKCLTVDKAREVLGSICPCAGAATLQQSVLLLLAAVFWSYHKGTSNH